MTSPTTIRAKAKCAACGGAVRARDRFCASCGTPIAAAQAAPAPPTVVPPPAATSASLQVPPLGEAALREQRKVVTILFADISGSTPLAEKLDPEDLRRILASYFNQLSRQIRRYEGTIDKYIGDAVMAVFGAPLSHEDDAERSIHAALAMHRSIAKLNDDLEREHGVRLSLRIGINTGEVVAGMLGGGDVQSAYTVVGDAVNTAQRFESVAPLNEVLVSETTRRLALHAFEFETLPPVALKGKAALVPAYRVIRRRDEEIEPDASPLVGRREELAFLRSAVEDALAGRGRVLHIRGEAGVGKSRLVSEFRVALAANIARIAARCASYETNTPYALIADLVRGAFRIHAVDDEAAARAAIAVGAETFNMPLDETATALLLDVIGFNVSLVIEPEQKRRLLVLLMRSLLQAAGARTSFVVITEDLHWIDPASGAMLAELVRDMPERPGVFITTARTGWHVPWEAEIVDLPALTEEEARTLIEELFEGGVDDVVARAILERAGGNPFYIEEVARELRRGGSTVPATVQEVIEARLDRLVDQTNRVVRNAAVIGVSFWYRLLERLIPREPLAPHLATLEEEAFIVAKTSVPELTYAFRQPLIREVAYQTQLLATRRATHTAVGQAIEILYGDRLDEFVDLLAYHFQRGEDPAKALHWLVRAGDRARGLYANTEALALFTSALQLARKDDSTFGASAILERIGDVQRLTGQYDAALASYRQAGELPGGSSAADGARIARKSAVAFRAKGDYTAALSALKEARERLGADDHAEAARIEVQVGEVHFRQGRYDDARGALRAAVDLGERVGADDAVADGLKLLGNVANNVGDLHEAVELYQRTGAAYERLGDPVGTADVMSNLAMLYRRMDRFEESLDAYHSSLALREKVGHVWGVATTHNNLGELSRTRGEPRAAIPSYEWAMGIFERIGARVEATVVLMNLGAARVEAGDVEPGRETLHEAERRFVELGGTKFLPSVHRDLAFGALKAGEIDEAERHAERALELARDAKAKQTEAVVQRIIAEIALARGEREKARSMLLSAIEALRALDESAERRKAEAVLARV